MVVSMDFKVPIGHFLLVDGYGRIRGFVGVIKDEFCSLQLKSKPNAMGSKADSKKTNRLGRAAESFRRKSSARKFARTPRGTTPL